MSPDRRSPCNPSPTPASPSSPTSPTTPSPTLIERGLFVTFNSDDPAYLGGYLNENYQAVAEAFALTRQTLCTLARNSFEATFLDDAEKTAYVAEVGTYQEEALA